MLANGVKETTATTGTGTITLSAVTGFARFANAFAVGDLVSYSIRDGNDWEWGLGTVGASNTLTRDVVTAKYASGAYSNMPASGLSLSGSAEVYCAQHTGTYGARVGRSTFSGNPTRLVRTVAGVTSSSTLTAGAAYYVPFTVDRVFKISALGCRVQTGAAGVSIDIGIYNSGMVSGKERPTTRICQVTGLDGTTSGEKSASVSAVLVPGQLYWSALLALGGAPGVQGYPASQLLLAAEYINTITTANAGLSKSGLSGLAADASAENPSTSTAAPAVACWEA